MAESVVVEPTSDDDIQSTLTDIEGDCSDAGLCVDDVDYVKALEIVATMQERVNGLHTYLTEKVNSNG